MSDPKIERPADAVPQHGKTQTPATIADSLVTPTPHTESSSKRKKQATTFKPDQTPLWKMILEVTAGICGVALVIITAYYTHYASQQAEASITAANAAASAADTAKKSLDLTRHTIESSEVALLQPNVSIRDVGKGPFLQIDIINSGRIAATNVGGQINVTNHPPIELANAIVSSHSPSPDYQSGFITRTIELPAPLDLQKLGKQHLQARMNIHYWNGLETIYAQFCYGLLVSPYTSAQEWQDCENQKTLQQKLN